MAQEVKVLLFDLGGVIIDIDFDRVFHYWSEKSGTPAIDIKSRFSPDKAYQQHERGEITPKEFYASLRASLKIDIPDTEFHTGWNNIFIGTMPGIPELLAQIRNKIPIYCFTNTNNTHRDEWQSNYANAVAHFNNIYISSEIGLRKPDKDAFDHVTQDINNREGAQPHEILFLDDSEENLVGAKNAGLQTVLVTQADDVKVAVSQWMK